MGKIDFGIMNYDGVELIKGCESKGSAYREKIKRIKVALYYGHGYRRLNYSDDTFDSTLEQVLKEFQREIFCSIEVKGNIINESDIDGKVGKRTWYAIFAPKLSSKFLTFVKDWEAGPDRETVDIYGRKLYDSSRREFICGNVGDGDNTIGYGSTSDSIPTHPYRSNGSAEGDRCSLSIAEKLFKREMAYTVADVCQTLSNKDIYATQEEFEALVDYQFNAGAVCDGANILDILKYSETNRTKIAKAFLEKTYLSTRGGDYQIGVFKRRYAQLDIFLDGSYDNRKIADTKAIELWETYVGGVCPY